MSAKPQEDAMLRLHDERNIASLVLIPTQDRLPKDLLYLERPVVMPSGQVVRIICQGMPNVGLPRGIDGDMLVALINRFIELGCPADDTIHATAYSLLQEAGLDTSARYYRALDTGLKRFKNTSYTITEGWFDAGRRRYVSAMFNIIDNIDYTHGEDGMDRRSVIRIRLNKMITASIRSGHIKPLNSNVYHRLGSVGARTLYRLLDAHLFDAAARSEDQSYHVTVPMLSWAVTCGILETRPHHVRTYLERMHAPLLDVGYLKEVTFTGRGQKTMLHYVYGDASNPAKQEHVELLLGYGVQRAQAEKAARELGDDVLLVVQRFEERLRKPGERIQNTGAYLAKLLREAASIIEAEHVQRAEDKKRQEQREQQAVTRAHESDRQLRLLEEEHMAQVQASPEQAAAAILSSFNVATLLKRGLASDDVEALREALRSGRIPGEDARKLVVQAMIPHKAEQALAAIRDLLRPNG